MRDTAILVLPLLLVGCVTGPLDRKLAESSLAREQEFTALSHSIESEPRQQIRWRDALERMQRDNIGLQQSRKTLEESEELTKKQWLSLIPRTSAYLSISKDIASLTDFDSDDLTSSVVANFNIPNPFDFYSSLYGSALQAQNARWSNSLDQRRAFADLYSAYMEAEQLRREEELLNRKWQTLLSGNPAEIVKNLEMITQQLSNVKRRRMSHRQNANRLLNTPGGNWELAGGLPNLSYRHRFRKMTIGRDFGKLALNLYAIGIESAILQKKRVKFRQWPTFTFGLSAPPLYSSEGNNGLNGEDFVLFSGANKLIDVNDIGDRESVRNAEYRLKITREQLRQTMEREAVRLIQLGEMYDHLLREERDLEAALKRLERRTSTEVEAVLADLESRSGIEMQALQISWQMKQLDLQYLIWDELFWKS